MEDLGCHTTHVETKFWDIRKVPTLAHLKKTGKHIANDPILFKKSFRPGAGYGYSLRVIDSMSRRLDTTIKGES
jgi:hypothetical protein